MADPIVFKPRRPCPVCKKLSLPKYHPFCSSRCAEVDLGRWLGGTYAIPAEEEEGRTEMDTPHAPED